MFPSRLSLLLKCLILTTLFLFSQLSWAGVVVAGQEIGKATWADHTRLPTKQFKVLEKKDASLHGYRILWIEGQLVGTLKGSAELIYDAGGTLVGIVRIASPKPEAMLKQLAKASRARRLADQRYVSGDLSLRMVAGAAGDGAGLLYISSAALDAQLAAASVEAAGSKPVPGWKVALWLVGGAAGLVMLWVFGKLIWRHRLKFWNARAFIADYLLAFAVVGVIMHGLPAARFGYANLIFGVYFLGYSLVLVWALRTVRYSGWLPRKPVVELLWALPATPVLLLPVVVRNTFRSAHYAGMVLFFGQLLALAYYFFRPGLVGAMLLLVLCGLFGGGVARVYCAVFKWLNRKGRHPLASAAMTLVLWPLYPVVGGIYLLWTMLVGGLVVALYMLIPALLVWLLAAAAGLEWLKIVAASLPFIGLLPPVAGLFAMGVMPTGYSAYDFTASSFNPSTGLPEMGGFGANGFDMGGFDINPANGMQMFGGIGGIDVFGNHYGFNDHDPW